MSFTRTAHGTMSALPQFAGEVLQGIIRVDRLGMYATVEGIEDTLARLSLRIGERVGRVVRLQDALPDLLRAEPQLMQDFSRFFPELVAHVRTWIDGQPPLESLGEATG
ncbi:MAG: ACP phosphodiesterase [Pirellulales bacterium]